jgi:hypothetical protein
MIQPKRLLGDLSAKNIPPSDLPADDAAAKLGDLSAKHIPPADTPADDAAEAETMLVDLSAKNIPPTDPPADEAAKAAAMLGDQSPKNNPPTDPPADDAKNVPPADPPADEAAKSAASTAKKAAHAKADVDHEPTFGLSPGKTSFDRSVEESTGRLSLTERVQNKGNLKNDEDYGTGETGNPWDNFLVSEIHDHYYAVSFGKNHNSFGIYADVKRFEKEIEGVSGCIYESCDSYDQAQKYVEDYLHQQKEDKLFESSAVALAALEKKIHILGYGDLTQKQQEQARRLPKGINVDNIMIQMRLLWSATTINPTVGTNALSEIDIESPPTIRRAHKKLILNNSIQRHLF